MNREEFTKELEKRLSILEDAEIKKNVTKYKTMITRRINKGMSEEEAVADLGDFDNLVEEILSDYGIKDKKETTQSKTGFFAGFINTLESVVDSLSKKSAKEVMKMILEGLLIIVIVALFRIPFIFVMDLIANVFFVFTSSTVNVITKIVNIAIEIGYIIFAVLLFIALFKKMFEKYKD